MCEAPSEVLLGPLLKPLEPRLEPTHSYSPSHLIVVSKHVSVGAVIERYPAFLYQLLWACRGGEKFPEEVEEPHRSAIQECLDAVEGLGEDIDRRQADHPEVALSELWREAGAVNEQHMVLLQQIEYERLVVGNCA